MTWTIYTFGDGDLVAMILNAVKLLVGSGLGSLTTAAALAGVAIMLASVAFRTAPWNVFLQWFLGLVLVIWGLLSGTATVTVEDVIDPRIPSQVVTDLPLLIAVPAAVSSEVSYTLTKAATTLSLNGELGDPGTTIARPTMALQALLDAELPDGDLSQNLVTYLTTCILPEIGLTYTDQAAAAAPDLLAYITSANYAVNMPVMVDGRPGPTMTCPDVYSGVLVPNFSSTGTQPEYKRAVDQLACQLPGSRGLMTTGAGTCQNPPPPWDELQGALQTLQLTMVDPETAFKNVLIAKAWDGAVAGTKTKPNFASLAWARETQDHDRVVELVNENLARQQMLSASLGQALGRRNLLRLMRGLADGLVYLSSPMLLVAVLSPAIFRLLGLYTRLYIWLMLWGPLTAAAHYLITANAISLITATAIYGGNNILGIVRGNWWPLLMQVAQFNATATDIMFAIPALALGIAWGGVSGLGAVASGFAQRTTDQAGEAAQTLMKGGTVLARSQMERRIEGKLRGLEMPDGTVSTVGLRGTHFIGPGGTDVPLGHFGEASGQIVSQEADGSLKRVSLAGGVKRVDRVARTPDGRQVVRTDVSRYTGGPEQPEDRLFSEVDAGKLGQYTEDDHGRRIGYDTVFDPKTGVLTRYDYLGPMTRVTSTRKDPDGRTVWERTEDRVALPYGHVGAVISGEEKTVQNGLTRRVTYDDQGNGWVFFEGATPEGYTVNGQQAVANEKLGKGNLTYSGTGTFDVNFGDRTERLTGDFTTRFQLDGAQILWQTGTTHFHGNDNSELTFKGNPFTGQPLKAAGRVARGIEEKEGHTKDEHGVVMRDPKGQPVGVGTLHTLFNKDGSKVMQELTGLVAGGRGTITYDQTGTPVVTRAESGYAVARQDQRSYVVTPETPDAQTRLGSLFTALPGTTVTERGNGQVTVDGLLLMHLPPQAPGQDPIEMVAAGQVTFLRGQDGSMRAAQGTVNALVSGAALETTLGHEGYGATGATQFQLDPKTGRIVTASSQSGEKREANEHYVQINTGVDPKGYASQLLVEQAMKRRPDWSRAEAERHVAQVVYGVEFGNQAVKTAKNAAEALKLILETKNKVMGWLKGTPSKPASASEHGDDSWHAFVGEGRK